MPQEVFRQANFNGGELDPRMLGRRDLRAYASSAALAVNFVSLPQGPLNERPGMAFVDFVRGPLEAVPLGTMTAPSGGTPTDAATGDDVSLVTTTNLGTAPAYVVLQIDFGAPVAVSLVDLNDFQAVAGGDAGGEAPPTYPWEPLGGGVGGGGGGGGGGKWDVEID